MNPVETHDHSPPIVAESHDLCFRYQKSLVLEEVNFHLHEGESLCVIGPNGGGKSTLLKLMLGLLEPTRGTITVFGKSPIRARRELGYVPQALRFDPLYPVSALDIVLMGRLDRLGIGRYAKECREAAMNALEEVALADLAQRAFSNLSGGERQRVLIARALACEPSMLLLDEPTANIDLSVEEQLVETLAHLRERMTILLVTHDLDLVAEIGDSVLCVNHRVHRHGLPLTGEMVKEIYSGIHRVEHDQQTRHSQGDHSACQHD